jgi:hypothetical protein
MVRSSEKKVRKEKRKKRGRLPGLWVGASMEWNEMRYDMIRI